MTSAGAALAPGAVVVVRDEEWLVTQVEAISDGACIEVLGLSDLVRGQEATFHTTLDDVVPLDPREARITPDDSPRYRRARLWVEATLMKTSAGSTGGTTNDSTRPLTTTPPTKSKPCTIKEGRQP